MLGILANDHNTALALDNLAFFTDFLDRRSYFHDASSFRPACVQVDLSYFSTKFL